MIPQVRNKDEKYCYDDRFQRVNCVHHVLERHEERCTIFGVAVLSP